MLKVIQSLEKKFTKAKLIIFFMILFSFTYLFIPDEHFSGVNNISELIKNELLKQKVLNDIKNKALEPFSDLKNKALEPFSDLKNSFKLNQNNLVKELKKIEENVDEEYNPDKVEKSIFDKYFSRLYFSIITGCLLGYGDVYPISNRAKSIVMLQSLITIIIIVI